ncbi:hypothetical protein NDU88_000945 [Pleurodeles waltl]|uniref:Uncharacterized protein n=1 Tax=Pleurodeles waltl TaxID=8319 RepID=A0AAV7LBL9_PLEWA|nr:hypothetical protein NDU88_000945 [Pleurodeles waltl]
MFEEKPFTRAKMERHLPTTQESLLQDIQVAQMIIRNLHRKLIVECKEKERLHCAYESMKSALTDATNAKDEFEFVAEDLKAAKTRMCHRLQQLQELLLQEASMRRSLENSQEIMIKRLEDLESMLEDNHTDIQVLQQDGKSLRSGTQACIDRIDRQLQEAQIIKQMEQDFNRLRAELKAKDVIIKKLQKDSKDEQEKMAAKLNKKNTLLEEELNAVKSSRDTLKQSLTSLQAEHTKCVEKQGLGERNMTMRNKTMESTIYHLHEDLTKTAKERDDLLEMKETLVQEQIKILKELDEDRDEMKAELKQYQIDLNAMRTTLEPEKERNRHLEDQLASLKQEQAEQEKMAEKLNKKNTLLEEELKAVKSSRDTLEQSLTSLQAEHTKCVEKQGLAERKMTMRMESTIYQLHEDLTKTAKERDDLLEMKETLVQEQIKILKELDEDRDEMKAELKQYQIDLNAMRTTLEAEKERNRPLEDQLASLKQEQAEQEKMAEKLNKKNTLLEEELKAVKSSRDTLEQSLTSLQAEHTKCVEKQGLAERKMTMRMESTIYQLHEDLTKTAKERDDLLEKKETLVHEQIKILKELNEDRDEMKAELKQYQIDLNDMRTTLEAEKERNRHLEDQLASLKQEQHSQHQLEQTVAELSLRLHELASEKREFENQVKRLESELESSLATRSENKQLRIVITIMEAKLKKVNEEFSSGKIRQQKLESQLKQAKSILAQHEMDYAKSMKRWDDTIIEMMTKKRQMDAMEERERQVMTVRGPKNGWKDIPELKTSNFNGLTSDMTVRGPKNGWQDIPELKTSNFNGLTSDMTVTGPKNGWKDIPELKTSNFDGLTSDMTVRGPKNGWQDIPELKTSNFNGLTSDMTVRGPKNGWQDIPELKTSNFNGLTFDMTVRGPKNGWQEIPELKTPSFNGLTSEMTGRGLKNGWQDIPEFKTSSFNGLTSEMNVRGPKNGWKDIPELENSRFNELISEIKPLTFYLERSIEINNILQKIL